MNGAPALDVKYDRIRDLTTVATARRIDLGNSVSFVMRAAYHGAGPRANSRAQI